MLEPAHSLFFLTGCRSFLAFHVCLEESNAKIQMYVFLFSGELKTHRTFSYVSWHHESLTLPTLKLFVPRSTVYTNIWPTMSVKQEQTHTQEFCGICIDELIGWCDFLCLSVCRSRTRTRYVGAEKVKPDTCHVGNISTAPTVHS